MTCLFYVNEFASLATLEASHEEEECGGSITGQRTCARAMISSEVEVKNLKQTSILQMRESEADVASV